MNSHYKHYTCIYHNPYTWKDGLCIETVSFSRHYDMFDAETQIWWLFVMDFVEYNILCLVFVNTVNKGIQIDISGMQTHGAPLDCPRITVTS